MFFIMEEVTQILNAIFFFRATPLFAQVPQIREYVIRYYEACLSPVLPLYLPPLCPTARAYRQIFHY